MGHSSLQLSSPSRRSSSIRVLMNYRRHLASLAIGRRGTWGHRPSLYVWQAWHLPRDEWRWILLLTLSFPWWCQRLNLANWSLATPGPSRNAKVRIAIGCACAPWSRPQNQVLELVRRTLGWFLDDIWGWFSKIESLYTMSSTSHFGWFMISLDDIWNQHHLIFTIQDVEPSISPHPEEPASNWLMRLQSCGKPNTYVIPTDYQK